jgi:phosphatidylserine/phosphatidylglycerophosphate/cardiolipin synthase-like enzyme
MSNSSRPPRSKSKQTATLGGAAGILVVIALVVAQLLGIDVAELIEEESDTSTPQAPSATPAPVSDGTPVAAIPGGLQVIPGGYDGGWFQIYFTDPINTQDESAFSGAPIENALVDAIDGAATSIDAAVFELNSQPVTDALIRAHDRNVAVRVVTDGEFGLEDPESTVEQLEDAGIPVESDGSRNGLMHNKFFVFDGFTVWTGSTNITHNGLYNNNNNAMLIRSRQLAENYTLEFEEMFAGEFGTTSPEAVPNPDFSANGIRIETIFESEGNAPARLAALINSASSIRFLAFSLTRDDLMQPMIDRSQAGALDVRGIVEASSRRFVEPLYCAQSDRLQVMQDGNPDILHHKVFILDGEIVVMGSLNFSASAADNNDENTLIIYSPDIAQAYLAEFEKRWAEAELMPADAFDC